jgi:hypothetical protein
MLGAAIEYTAHRLKQSARCQIEGEVPMPYGVVAL